jgi:hypothetical protein
MQLPALMQGCPQASRLTLSKKAGDCLGSLLRSGLLIQ